MFYNLKSNNPRLSLQIVLFITVLPCVVFGQNLIPNGDFEDKRGRRYSARPWRFINTVDHFVMDGKSRMPYGLENWDVPKPRSGNVMVGIRVHTSYREFLQMRLPQPLEEGKRYLFEMYVKPHDDFNAYLKKLGASFYHRRPSYTSEYYIYNKPPQVETFDNAGIFDRADTLTDGWVRISGTYRAKGGEKYLTIGNFSKHGRKDRFRGKRRWLPTLVPRAYYFIDDVGLFELETTRRLAKDEDAREKIDSTVMIPDTLPYTLEEENYIYRLDRDTALVLENIRFAFGSDELLPSSYNDLELVVEYLNSNLNVSIRVIGHTDDVGTAKANMKMSEKRARRVYEYFVNNEIRPDRVKYEGKGQTQPLFPNNSAQNRAKNRRVEIRTIRLKDTDSAP